MTVDQILSEIRPLGRDGYKRVLMNHGVREPCLGVKIEDLKKIVKRVKVDYRLALDLYDTGIYDAMYLAGLIADDAQMTKDDLRQWAAEAYCGPLCAATVAWVAAGSPHGWELGREWIQSPAPLLAATGWATLGSLTSITPDTDLNLPELDRLLQVVRMTIHQSPEAVRGSMNSFLIAVGSHVQPLSEAALNASEAVGVVRVDMGKTACRLPYAPDFIRKVKSKGLTGRKKKTAKC